MLEELLIVEKKNIFGYSAKISARHEEIISFILSDMIMLIMFFILTTYFLNKTVIIYGEYSDWSFLHYMSSGTGKGVT